MIFGCLSLWGAQIETPLRGLIFRIHPGELAPFKVSIQNLEIKTLKIKVSFEKNLSLKLVGKKPSIQICTQP